MPSAIDIATVAHLDAFDEVIDVRTPSEFAEDHVPGACNCPVLSDAERARVGTIYKQQSAFMGKKLGAALVARNIAEHIETRFVDRPRTWRPLVYCWRGGKRSEALVHILRQIGWDARRLEGGYKAYRRALREELTQLASRFELRVVCGLTGSGKSRLLEVLERLGAQVLDLETLAVHRGSVLGSVPDRPQPSQKMFESRLWARLRQCDPARPVFVESESQRIGVLHVPAELMSAMWNSRCIRVETNTGARVQLLKDEYVHFLADAQALGVQLDRLVQQHGRAVIERWKMLAHDAQWDGLLRELLETHYDPAYTRSIVTHYPRLADAVRVRIDSADDDSFLRAGRALLQEAVEATTTN